MLDAQKWFRTVREIGYVPQLVQALEAGGIDAVVIDPGQSAQLRGKGFSLVLDMYPANILGVQRAGRRRRVLSSTPGCGREGRGQADRGHRIQPCAAERRTRSEDADGPHEDLGTRRGRERLAKLAVAGKPQALRLDCRDAEHAAGMALNDPKVLNVKIEDLADDRFVRKLDESGAIDRLYERYGVK